MPETLRGFFDRHPIGLILIGMPGLEKRLARHPRALHSRIGFAHHSPLKDTDKRAWPSLSLGACGRR